MVLQFLYTFHPLSLQALNRGKGLLPEPNAMQILTGLNNPAALKMLLASLNPGHKQGTLCSFFFCRLVFVLIQAVNLSLFSQYAGLLGVAPAVPLLANPALSAALMQLLLQNQVQQVQSIPPFLNPSSPATVPAACVLALTLFFSPPSKLF